MHRKIRTTTMFETLRVSLAGLAVASLGLGCGPKETANPDEGTATGGETTKTSEQDEQAKKAREAAERRAAMQKLPPLPGIKAAAKVEFPKPVVAELGNGLTLIILEDHETPLVEVSLRVKAGEIYAPNDNPVLASLTGSLLGEGTTKTPKAKFDEKVDSTGGSLFAGAGDELAFISASMLSRDLDKAMSLVAEQAMMPAFPEASIKKLKDATIQGVRSEKSNPQALIGVLASRVVYGESSAYGHSFPTDAEIEAVTRDQIVAFHAKHYVPNNAMLVVAGDVDAEQVEKLAKKRFGKWKKGEDVAVPKVATPPAPPTKPVVHIIDRKASAQANIAVFVPAPSIGEAGWLETKVAQNVLSGGTLSTKLNFVLREQLGLTYGAYVFHSYGYDGGVFAAGGGTKNKTADQFADALINLVFELGDAPVDDKDLRRVKAFVSGRFALEAEGVDSVADKTVTSMMYGLPGDFWDRYRTDIEAIDADSLFETTKVVFDRNRMQIVAVGKAKKLEEQLSKYGEVRIYDTDLNLKK